MEKAFIQSYLFARRVLRKKPAMALVCARTDERDGKKRYAPGARATGQCNPEFSRHGYERLRWVENTDAAGLRFIGYADALASIRHNGWYADAFQDEIYRGAVWQLPGRNGRPLFVYGYPDPCNEGAALVCFDLVQGDGNGSAWDKDDGARTAANLADGMAEAFAEEAREYSEAWQAAREWQDIGEEMQETRREARELVRAMRDAIKAGQTAAAPICEALRARIRTLSRDWEAAREKRESLDDQFYYWPGDGAPRQSIAEFAAANL